METKAGEASRDTRPRLHVGVFTFIVWVFDSSELVIGWLHRKINGQLPSCPLCIAVPVPAVSENAAVPPSATNSAARSSIPGRALHVLARPLRSPTRTSPEALPNAARVNIES